MIPLRPQTARMVLPTGKIVARWMSAGNTQKTAAGYVIAVLCSVVVTLTGGWLTVGRTMVSAAEMDKVIAEKQAPIKEDVKELKTGMHEIQRDMGHIRTQQVEIKTKLDLLLQRLGSRPN